jgi:hypothetical protein
VSGLFRPGDAGIQHDGSTGASLPAPPKIRAAGALDALGRLPCRLRKTASKKDEILP